MSKSKTRQLEDALDCIDKIFDYVDDVIMAGHFGYDDDLESELLEHGGLMSKDDYLDLENVYREYDCWSSTD